MDIETAATRFGARQRHILRLPTGILICAAMCATFIGFLHFASAHNFAEIGMPLDSKGVDEIYRAPKVKSESRPIDDLIYLIFRERETLVLACMW